MVTTVTAAHHFIWRHLYASMEAAPTPTSKLMFVTPDKESSMSTFWQEEELEQICSRESLMEKAADIEKRISVQEHEREIYDFDPTRFYENHFYRVTDFLLRQDIGRFIMCKYVSDKKIPWQRRRRLGMALPKMRQQPVF